MKLKLLFTSIALTASVTVHSQSYQQYFDGADTSATNSLQITFGNDTNNIWHVGPPQKTLFDSASTQPNAIVTDTIQTYPSNDTSQFYLTLPFDSFWPFGILALQWTQKLDLESDHDMATIDFKTNTDSAWHSAFNNPYVYNFYGYQSQNLDTLTNGTIGFSGSDSTWRDIWLCYDMSYYVNMGDTFTIRYTILSDSNETNQDGWIMDNFMAHLTYIHTIQEAEQKEYVNIFPSPSSGEVNIQVKKINEFHLIESMILTNVEGKVVKTFGSSPTKFKIDISDQPDGVYFLKVNTNLESQTVKVVLKK